MKYNDKNIEQNVMDNVSALLSEKGVKGWNMDLLSQKSGLAKNTLYRIIGSKEDIISKVLIRNINATQYKLVKIMENEQDYMIAFEKVVAKFPELMSAMYVNNIQNIFIEYPSIEENVRAHKDELTKSIIGFIQQGVECGKLKQNVEPEFLFEILQQIVLSYIKLGYKGKNVTRKLSMAFSYIVEGIKA